MSTNNRQHKTLMPLVKVSYKGKLASVNIYLDMQKGKCMALYDLGMQNNLHLIS